MTLLSLRGSADDMLADRIPLTRTVRRKLLHHKGFVVGASFALALAVLAVIGPLIARAPNITDYAHQLAAPSAHHWLGTDAAGRDEFARTVAGARDTLGAALLVFLLATIVGVGTGVIAGFVGGPVDAVLSRLMDLLLGLPQLVLALAVVGALGPSFANLILAMAITSWAFLGKLARSLTSSSRHRPDVIAARMAGMSATRIAFGHVLPGVLAQALIAATLQLGDTILNLAALSFLGLGAQPPTAEWGGMLNDSRLNVTIAPWLLIGPGVGILLAVTAATLISDALRDCTDPGHNS